MIGQRRGDRSKENARGGGGGGGDVELSSRYRVLKDLHPGLDGLWGAVLWEMNKIRGEHSTLKMVHGARQS